MTFKRIYLKENNCDVWLDTYAADPVQPFVKKAILVIPGGGYTSVCSDREGEPVALAFIPHGCVLGNAITSRANPKYENPAIAKWVEQAVYWADQLSK